MKLEEMTNAQLVNIILRKDDVETRLRNEIATLQKENKRLVNVKRFRVLAFGLIIAVVCLVFIGLLSCNSNSKPGKGQIVTTVLFDNFQAKGEERLTTQDWGDEPMFDKISFFGEPIVMDDWTSIHHQIRVIASENDMLNYATDIDLCVLSIGEVGFGVNIDGDGIHLIASIQPDDPKMRHVIDYLNSIYGEPEEDDPDCYCWRAGANGRCTDGMVIRLRPLHSEEGGTVLFFGK